jgi:hypothetical protein
MRKSSPSEMRLDRLAVLLCGQDGLAVTVAETETVVSAFARSRPKLTPSKRGAAGEGEQGKRQGNRPH